MASGVARAKKTAISLASPWPHRSAFVLERSTRHQHHPHRDQRECQRNGTGQDGRGVAVASLYARCISRRLDTLPWVRASVTRSLRSDAPRDGFLFVAQVAYPGWSAWVDGRPAPLHPAEVLGSAIELPAGAHAIELRFVPYAFHAGVLIAAAAAMVATCVLLGQSLRRRPPAKAPR